MTHVQAPLYAVKPVVQMELVHIMKDGSKLVRAPCQNIRFQWKHQGCNKLKSGLPSYQPVYQCSRFSFGSGFKEFLSPLDYSLSNLSIFFLRFTYFL